MRMVAVVVVVDIIMVGEGEVEEEWGVVGAEEEAGNLMVEQLLMVDTVESRMEVRIIIYDI